MGPEKAMSKPADDEVVRGTTIKADPGNQKTIEKELEKVPGLIESPSHKPATIEIDSNCSDLSRKLAAPEKIQLTNGTQNGPQEPIKLTVLTDKIDEQSAKKASRVFELSNNEKAASRAVKSGRIRHIIALLALSSIVMANMNRQAYNQALTRMAKRAPIVTNLNPNVTDLMVPPVESSTSAVFDYDEASEPIVSDTSTENSSSTITEAQLDDEGFDWTASQISTLQSSFAWGYAIFMVPGGRMSEIYGAKWIIFISSFGSALCSLMTPFLIKNDFNLLICSRILMGLCQTGVSPALYALYSRWLPPEEASLYLPMIKVGVMLGFTCGSLVNSLFAWQPMFYILGIVGIAWSAFWVFFASSIPSENGFISKAEQSYIEERLEMHSRQSKSKNEDKKERPKKVAAPWSRILKNPVVLAFTFTKFTVKLSTEAQSSQIPMYLKRIFLVSDELNGVLNGTNFAIQAIFTGVVAYVAKVMVSREQFGLRKTGIRRMFQALNNFGMGLAYLLISFNMGSLELVCCAVILLSISSMFGAGGEAVLPIDLTTEYSASIMAIANCVANLSGIILPMVVGYFLNDELSSSENWNRVWWFVSFTMACGGLAFSYLVKAKIQGFNEGKKVKKAILSDANGSNPRSIAEMPSNTMMSHL